MGDSGAWLGGVGSTEWRLVTGVILLGGVGGERRVGAGTMITPLPGCESSAGEAREKIKSGVWNKEPVCGVGSQSAAGDVSFNGTEAFSGCSCY